MSARERFARVRNDAGEPSSGPSAAPRSRVYFHPVRGRETEAERAVRLLVERDELEARER